MLLLAYLVVAPFLVSLASAGQLEGPQGPQQAWRKRQTATAG